MTIQTTASPLATTAAQADTRTVLLNEVSWGAIFAGAVTALVTQVIVNLVGVGVGLASVGTQAADNPSASTVSMGAGLWFVASGIVASLAGGLIAGRLSGKPLPGAAALHGLVSWAVTTLVVLYLLTSAASGLVGGTLSTVSGRARRRGQPRRRHDPDRRAGGCAVAVEDLEPVRRDRAEGPRAVRRAGPAGRQGRGGGRREGGADR